MTAGVLKSNGSSTCVTHVIGTNKCAHLPKVAGICHAHLIDGMEINVSTLQNDLLILINGKDPRNAADTIKLISVLNQDGMKEATLVEMMEATTRNALKRGTVRVTPGRTTGDSGMCLENAEPVSTETRGLWQLTLHLGRN
jgi:hypothetical protein